ncbi:MAG: hypothetical protein K2L49_03830, partial [Muribaculaceae bacterium]|nr:hypothetical protein [Muribaculaceae bacterium]
MKASQVITHLITGGAILLQSATGCSSGSYSNDDKIIYRCDSFTMYVDSIVSDSVRATALSPSCVNIIIDANTTDMYADSATTSTYPLFRSEQPLVDVMYSLERSTALAHDPFTITMLSAITDPRQAMADLRAMIGSDGLPKSRNWPIVDTSAAWIIAASEVYAVTGDKQWLREILPVAKRAIQRAIDVNYDLRYGLIRGTIEYSDGTTPYVPTWMTGTDRIASLELGVNSMYVAALTATAMMAAEAGDTADHYKTLAESVALNVCNRLWIPEAGYFSSMLYGAPYPVQSHNIDYTAQAITIIAGISNKEISKSIVSKTPLPSPYLPDTYPRPYDAAPTRPSLQRQAIFGLASAVTGYTTGIVSAIGSVIYASVTYPDHYNGALSSLILRAIAGMRFTPEGITFVPSIPAAMQGDKTISGIKYRDSELCVTLHGTGSSIGRFMIDGKICAGNIFPSSMHGHHDIDIYMMENPDSIISMVSHAETPVMLPVPKIRWETPCRASITNHSPSTEYDVIINGVVSDHISVPEYTLDTPLRFTTVAFQPVTANRT